MKRVHVVSYTHWDREFRWDFELTRMKLVDCIDHLLDIMERDPEYRHFLLDGQACLLDDYLEIRPEKEPVIRRLASDGRLEIGPWYTLPDCATVNGESVIRNLQHGLEVSRRFREPLSCGYSVFSFGQIAQLPQIYGQFGIDCIIFYKYMSPHRSSRPEFIWEAPDGTRAYASRLGREARWNFFFAGHIPIVYGLDPWDKRWRYEYGTLGKVFHTADPEGYGWFHEILDPETSFHPEKLEEGFRRALATVEDTAIPESLLFFDGTDFTEPHPLVPEILARLRERFGGEYEIVHSTLGAYVSEMKASLARMGDLDVVTGAMRDGPVGAVHSDVMTIHPELKLQSAATETALLRCAEPLCSVAFAVGAGEYPTAYLRKAWKLVFQSHPHDSIHGLGPADLSRGAMARLRQAETVARGLERRALGDITKEIATDSVSDSQTFLVVHNTASFPRSEVVEAWVDVPAEIALDEVVIEDADGRPCPTQEISRETTRAGVYHPRSRNMPFYCTRVRLLFWAEGVPALGYKTFKVKWRAKREYPYPHEDWEPPRLLSAELLTGPREAANEHLRLRIDPDGTLALTNLATGRTFGGLNRLADQADVGNMWMSAPPPVDGILHSIGGRARIACLWHGPLAARFVVETELAVPARFDRTAMARSTETEPLRFSCELTLRKGCRYVEVRAEVENRSRDHYLKVCFPTGLDVKTTCADGSFIVTEYPARPDLSRELARHPAQLWFDASDGAEGLAVLSRSTKDYEILQENGTATMAMGLLRSVRLRIPCDNRLWMEYPGDESSQALGTTVHSYALLPHQGGWEEAELYREALRFVQPMKCCQFGRQKGRLPLEASFLRLEGANLVLSAVKKAESRDGILVRFFNPTARTVRAALEVGFPFARAHMVRLSEERAAELVPSGGAAPGARRLELDVGKGKIVTLELERA